MLIKLKNCLVVNPDKVVGISTEAPQNNTEPFRLYLHMTNDGWICQKYYRDIPFMEREVDIFWWLINNRVDFDSQEAMDRKDFR